MIIIGEKINGAIPSVKQAIADRDAELIKQRAQNQTEPPEHTLSTVQPVLHRNWNMMRWYG